MESSQPRIGVLRSASSPQGIKECLFCLQLPWSPEPERRLRTQNEVIDYNATDDKDGDNDNDKQFLKVMKYFRGKEKHYLHFI